MGNAVRKRVHEALPRFDPVKQLLRLARTSIRRCSDPRSRLTHGRQLPSQHLEFPTFGAARPMALVTVKDKFQVTIPSRLREQLPLAVGDILEAEIEGGTIVLRPKAVVDRAALAQRVERAFAATPGSPEDAARSEDELMAAAIDEVAAVRTMRRSRRR